MESFTVYTSKNTPAFRVVAGEHSEFADKTHAYSVHVYQGATREDAILAAYGAWKDRRPVIAEQIARFLDHVPGRNRATGKFQKGAKEALNTQFNKLGQSSASGHSAEPSGRETVPGADNAGDTLIGKRVRAGRGSDLDIGRVESIDSETGMAFVSWDSGVKTPYPAYDLTVTE